MHRGLAFAPPPQRLSSHWMRRANKKCTKRNWQRCCENSWRTYLHKLTCPFRGVVVESSVEKHLSSTFMLFFCFFKYQKKRRKKKGNALTYDWRVAVYGQNYFHFVNLGWCAFYPSGWLVCCSLQRQICTIGPVNNNQNHNKTVHVICWNNTITFLLSTITIIITMATSKWAKKKRIDSIRAEEEIYWTTPSALATYTIDTRRYNDLPGAQVEERMNCKSLGIIAITIYLFM